MSYKFKRDPKNNVILLNMKMDDRHNFDMVLDTGASVTTIDINTLYLNDIHYRHIDFIDVETANGVIEVELVEVDAICALGLQRKKMQIQVYDFFKHGILTNYDGTLGLDFFEGTRFTVDMTDHTIEIQERATDDGHFLRY